MPFSNPEDAIKSAFKHLTKKKKYSKPKTIEEPLISTEKQGDVAPPIIEISDDNAVIAEAKVVEAIEQPETKALDTESSLQIQSPSGSYLSVDTKDLDGQSSDSADSYLSEDPRESEKNIPKAEEKVIIDPNAKIETIVNEVVKAVAAETDRIQLKTNKKLIENSNQIGDRRRNTWLPCTCPQYKVSCELATKCNAQAIFFAKMMVVKVIQLFIINLIVFTVAYNRDSTLQFITLSHDWVFLAFGIFLVLLSVVRITLSYRARWPKVVALIAILPMTALIAFMCTVITVVYNSILIPLVTATVLLTFLMLTFMPYLLRKFVMHRITNFAGFGLTFVSCLMLLFLNEFESIEITYIQFISHVWLPALLLSEFVVMVSILEIQRMLFGLSFNVSTKRWHIAALYL